MTNQLNRELLLQGVGINRSMAFSSDSEVPQLKYYCESCHSCALVRSRPSIALSVFKLEVVIYMHIILI